MKKRTKILAVIFSFVFLLSSFTIANAADEEEPIPEVEVKVNHTGITTTEVTGDISRYENVLTRISDVLLAGDSMYTYDSKTENELKGTEPGETLYGDMGCTLRDMNGEKITELDITVQTFVNVDKEYVADYLYSEFAFWHSFQESEIKSIITQMDDILSSTFGTYLPEKHNLKIKFSDDGTFSIKLPENFPDDYLYAITEIEDPITGEKININEYYRLFIALGNAGGGDIPEPDPEEDDGHRYYSIDSTTTSYVDLEPSLSASISSEKYDVTQGIPTSENVNYSITADNALYNITTRTRTIKAGVRDITIKLSAQYPQKYTEITYNESGDKIETTEIEMKTITKTVTKKFSYDMPELLLYDVPGSNIYPVLNGAIQAINEESVLSSGMIGLTGSQTKGTQTLTITADIPNVKDIEWGYLGTFSSKSEAQKALNKNDGTSVKNRIIAAVHSAVGYTGSVNYSYYGLNVTTTTHNGVKPVVARVSGGNTQMIPPTYPNGTYVAGGNVLYAGAQSFPLSPNNVIVHTPVVNGSYVSSTSEFVNQKISINSNVKYLMLDEQFTIYIPDNGIHNNIKGYGNRKYNSKQGVTALQTTWGKIKDVKLPFDAYLHYSRNGAAYKYFIKAGTWLSDSGVNSVISLTNNTYTFTIPVWAKEGACNIETRVIAENAITKDMYNLSELDKNASVQNYVATKLIPVEVIGKIYDLRVSASNDPGWTSIYSWKNGTNYIAADEFPFGAQGQNKITQYKYAPKLGYTFVFDFKTKGTKSNNIDISVQPEGFYFVSKNGGKAQEVDLYYNTTTKKNIKIDLTDTNTNLTVKLREAFMKIPAQEFVDSTRIYNSKYNYSLGVNVGTFAKMNLPHSLRLCYNNFAEYINTLYGRGSTENSISTNAGNRDTVIGSVGHWYAGYRLPASAKAILKGSDITTAIKNNKVLTEGYILVKFDLKTKYQNNSGNYDYLQYMGPEAINEAGNNTGELIIDWTKGGTQTIKLPNGNTAEVPVGSVAIFEAGVRSSNDAEVGGTH